MSHAHHEPRLIEVDYVYPAPDAGFVILDRIEPGAPLPDYCIHGRTTCIGGCDEWVWLGDKTHELVASGKARPLCQPCAVRLMPSTVRPYDHVADHQRADGPHE